MGNVKTIAMSILTIEASYLMEPSGSQGVLQLDPKVWVQLRNNTMKGMWNYIMLAAKLCNTNVYMEYCRLTISSKTTEEYEMFIEILNKIVFQLEYKYGHSSFQTPPRIKKVVQTTFGHTSRYERPMPSLPVISEL